jgi:hypothetical protein
MGREQDVPRVERLMTFSVPEALSSLHAWRHGWLHGTVVTGHADGLSWPFPIARSAYHRTMRVVAAVCGSQGTGSGEGALCR